LGEYPFEEELFRGVKDYDSYLSLLYGDYMKLPPEDQRENRHQIVEVDFGE
jgi:lipopolysaccharide cholinephosphotransferase